MIPYIQIPEYKLGPIPIHPFGLLVLIGVTLGIWLSRRRAVKLGVDLAQLDSFTNWMLVAAFISGHVLDMVFYYPEEILRRPWALLFLWESLSSFGGFVGAVVGVLLWKRFRGKGQPILPLVDLIIAVFPFAWSFGRAGCATVHDHPGIHTSASNWLAVAYPDGPRYDLGLLEMFFAILLSALFYFLWKKDRPVGTYTALACLIYAPVRLCLDFLRRSDGEAADVRYAGLTFAQWSCLVLFGFGCWVVYYIRQQGKADKPPPTKNKPSSLETQSPTLGV